MNIDRRAPQEQEEYDPALEPLGRWLEAAAVYTTTMIVGAIAIATLWVTR